ncbi:MAG: fumarate hydratase [Desulfurococcales archaeon]|nr:fumarate hydratase [Desulfurococcales archaeon]
MSVSRETLESLFYTMAKTAVTRIPVDVYEALKAAREREDNPLARAQLDAILKNIEIACSTTRPICQDTGTPYLFLEIGDEFPLRSQVVEAAKEGIRRATREGYLRPNAVDPVYFKNSGDNTGRFIPWVHVDLVPGDSLRVHLMMKGGGSEAPSTLVMSTPLKGWENVKRAAVEAVANAGPLPCPPVIVSVAVAAGADIATSLAKRALLRPIGERHPDPKVARIEEELLDALNKLGLGPHGFGGKTSVLDVKFEYAHRHPATFAIAVITSCWATRRVEALVTRDGEARILSKHLLPTPGGGCAPGVPQVEG